MSFASRRRHRKSDTSDERAPQGQIDVTDSSADASYAEVMSRAKHFLDHMKDYPVWTEPGGKIIEVSEATCRALGYTRDELLNMTVFDISPSITPEFWQERWRLLKEVGTSEIETSHKTKDGRLVPVELVTALIAFEGKEYHCAFCRDITERKLTESHLLRLQYSLDRMEDYPTWNDQEGRLIEVSESTVRHLEYSREELLEMTIFDICPDLDTARWKRSWKRSSIGESFQVQVHHRAKSGRTFPVEVTVNPMVFDGQKYHCTFCRDVTERKKAESALERLRYSLDQMNDYFIWVDSDARIIEVSESTCRHLKYTREELLRMTPMDLSPGLTLEIWRKGWDRAKESGTFSMESDQRAKDGTVILVELVVNHMTFDGQEYDCVFYRDISERKALEESLQLTKMSVDEAPDMIHWVDADGKIVYANRSMCEFLGYSLEELQDMRIWDVNTELTPELFRERWPKAEHGGIFINEATWRAKDGQEVSVEISATNVAQRDRELGLAFVRDITQRNKAAQELRDSEEQLRRLYDTQSETLNTLKERDEQLLQAQKMEAVGRLAGGIAHDFNNVLTTIIGYSDLILSSPDRTPDSVAEDVAEIKQAAERAGALTKRILTFSRRQTLQPKRLSLNTVVSDTQKLLERTIGADVTLETSLDPDLAPAMVDEQHIVQVLLNLAVNARDAMPDGGVLTIATANVDLDEQFCKTHPEAHPGPHVLLSVTDTGSGMDSEVISHVFEPFYTTKPPGQGTGLGLATVYGVVTQSGGYIHIDSTLGKGTAFYVYLPRAEQDDAPPPRSEDKGHGRTVVVVDPDAPYGIMTTRMLERLGFKVLSFTDGQQALAVLNDHGVQIDALVMDEALRGGKPSSELEAAAERRRSGLFVILTSAEATAPTKVPGGSRDTEQAPLLGKPFTAQELEIVMRKLLDRPNTTDRSDGDRE